MGRDVTVGEAGGQGCDRGWGVPQGRTHGGGHSDLLVEGWGHNEVLFF